MVGLVPTAQTTGMIGGQHTLETGVHCPVSCCTHIRTHARTHARTYRYSVVHHYRYTRVHHFRYEHVDESTPIAPR